jgi:hypothetical protein
MTNETLPAVVEDDAAVTVRTERITEERYAADDEAAGARIVSMVVPKAYGVRAATNGANITASVEVDAAYAADIEELIGEQTFIFKIGPKAFGECSVTSVNTKADADNRARTIVSFKWSADQRSLTKDLVDLIDLAARLELWQVQLSVFGAKPE